MKLWRALLCLTLLLNVLLLGGDAAVLAQDDDLVPPRPPEPFTVRAVLQESGVDYQVLVLVPPGETAPALVGVENLGEDGDQWHDAADNCRIKTETSKVAFFGLYSGTVRFVFKSGTDEMSSQLWVSDQSFEIKNGQLSRRPQLAAEDVVLAIDVDEAEAEAEANDGPTDFELSLVPADGGFELKFPDSVPAEDRELLAIEEVDANGIGKEVPFPLFAYDVANSRINPTPLFKKDSTQRTITGKLRFIFETAEGPFQSQLFDKAAFLKTTPTAVLPSFSGTADRASELRLELTSELKKVDLAKLVVDEAMKWPFHPNGGTLVFQYDHYPEATAKKIADVLRKTVARLDAANEDDEEAMIKRVREEMMRDFDTFYNSGDRPYAIINVYVTVWQPFLKHLHATVQNKINDNPPAPGEMKTYYQLVAADLADGFDTLSQKIEGAKSAATNPSSTFGQTGGQPTYYNPSDRRDGSRKRKKFCCWNLLLGL